MLYLVTGGSGSGKSEFAEELAVSGYSTKNTAGTLYYVATMYPTDEECQERIAKHRLMRKDKGFTTVECYHHLASVSAGDGDVFLIECMSNLLANEMYQKGGQLTARGAEADRQLEAGIVEPLMQLAQKAERLVVVTNEVFSDGIQYDGETREYLRLLGRLNVLLAEKADVVSEVVCSIPVYHKGTPQEMEGIK